MFVCLFVRPPACLPSCLCVCLFVCLPLSLYVCPRACLPVPMSVCLSVSPPACLSVCLSDCLSVVCLYIYLPFYLLSLCLSDCLSLPLSLNLINFIKHFYTDIVFHPSLIFSGKAGACQSGAQHRTPL